MAEDDQHKPHHATARPPPGEEDVYSASTVVGTASDEMLAIIRGEPASKPAAIPSAPGLPKNLEVDSKIEAPRPAAGASPAQAIKTPLAEPVQFPPPADGAKELAYTATPLDVPVTQLTATIDPPPPLPVVMSPPAAPAALTAATDDNPNFKKGTLHPAVGIVLFFVAVVVVLAALIR